MSVDIYHTHFYQNPNPDLIFYLIFHLLKFFNCAANWPKTETLVLLSLKITKLTSWYRERKSATPVWPSMQLGDRRKCQTWAQRFNLQHERESSTLSSIPIAQNWPLECIETRSPEVIPVSISAWICHSDMTLSWENLHYRVFTAVGCIRAAT